jgi:hypothetical protein
MGDVAVAVSDVDDGLNERLDDEIYAFNAAATGLDDGRLLRVAVRGSDAELLAGLCGWTWGGCGYVESLWVRADQRGSGLARGSWSRRRRRCVGAAVNRWR